MFYSLPTLVNQYLLVDVIGKGAHSVVYKSINSRYSRIFAVKVLEIDQMNPNFTRDLYHSEVSALKKLDHPGIVKLFDSFEEKGKLFIVLEYCELGSIDKIIVKHQGVQNHDYLHLIESLLNALAFCHEKGIAHRDIKPSNILIDDKFNIKLADFAFSFFKEKELNDNKFIGSHSFIAPEIVSHQNYDPFLSDLWSLGVTIYHIIFGENLWPSDNIQELHKAITECSLPNFITGYESVDKIIRGLINLDPKKRMSLKEALELIKEDKKGCPPRAGPKLKKRNYSTNRFMPIFSPQMTKHSAVRASMLMNRNSSDLNFKTVPRRASSLGKQPPGLMASKQNASDL